MRLKNTILLWPCSQAPRLHPSFYCLPGNEAVDRAFGWGQIHYHNYMKPYNEVKFEIFLEEGVTVLKLLCNVFLLRRGGLQQSTRDLTSELLLIASPLMCPTLYPAPPPCPPQVKVGGTAGAGSLQDPQHLQQRSHDCLPAQVLSRLCPAVMGRYIFAELMRAYTHISNHLFHNSL